MPLSRTGAGGLIAIIVGGVASCLLVSVSMVAWMFWTADAATFRRVMICAILLPVILGVPWFLVLSLKMRQLAALNARLQHAAKHDLMTGLLNWSAFHDAFDRTHEAAARSSCPLALLLIDADNFKAINDRWGHQAGDATLRHVAQTLSRVIGAHGIVGRLGGEEFGVLLDDAGTASTRAIAEDVRATIADARFMLDDGTVIRMTVSIGGVVFGARAPRDAAIYQADRLLYRAKTNGRDRVEIEDLTTGPRAVASARS